MKTNYLIALCAMMFFAMSCVESENVDSKNDEQTEETEANNDGQTEDEDEVKEPVIEGPVSMKGGWREGLYAGDVILSSDENVPINRVDAEIVEGSGDYKIIYPKKIERCTFWGTVPSSTPASRPDYSEEILKVWVEGNIVHIERGQPAYDPNGSGELNHFTAYFMLEDGAGTKKLFEVRSVFSVGMDYGTDYLAEAQSLIDNDDYWQLEPEGVEQSKE